MRGLARQLLSLEIFICFLPCAFMLLAGMIMLPMQITFLWRNPLRWEGEVLMCGAVACGMAGFWSLVSVVSALFAGREKIEKPVLLLGGVALGAAPLVLQFVLGLSGDEIRWGIWFAMIVMPLVATAHILYLSRDMFIAGFRSSERPLVSPRMWLTVAVLVCLAVFVMVLRQGSSYAELAERRAYWMQHRPPAYGYDWNAEGWLEPMERGMPRRVRVVGSELTGASYRFSRGPGDTRKYAPPIETAWTMDDIFEALLDEKKRGSRVSAQFDDATGAVLRARVESDEPEADWWIEIQRLQPLDVAEARKPMPMFRESGGK